MTTFLLVYQCLLIVLLLKIIDICLQNWIWPTLSLVIHYFSICAHLMHFINVCFRFLFLHYRTQVALFIIFYLNTMNAFKVSIKKALSLGSASACVSYLQNSLSYDLNSANHLYISSIYSSGLTESQCVL